MVLVNRQPRQAIGRVRNMRVTHAAMEPTIPCDSALVGLNL